MTRYGGGKYHPPKKLNKPRRKRRTVYMSEAKYKCPCPHCTIEIEMGADYFNERCDVARVDGSQIALHRYHILKIECPNCKGLVTLKTTGEW